MTESRNVIEGITGLVVLIVCGIFVMVLYKHSAASGDTADSYTLKAAFDRADGLELGSYITVSGIKVGKVTEQELDQNTYSAVVKMSIQQTVKLPLGTSAEIISNGLLGEKYIALVPGAESDYLQNGDTIEFTQSSISIESLISKMMFGIEMGGGNKEDFIPKDDLKEDSCNETPTKPEGAVSDNSISGTIVG